MVIFFYTLLVQEMVTPGKVTWGFHNNRKAPFPRMERFWMRDKDPFREFGNSKDLDCPLSTARMGLV
jgi:hypothetical protein